MKSIGIGGQAVVSGVMLKQDKTYAIAMKNDNTDEVEVIYDKYKGILGTGLFYKVPIVRGIFKLIDDLVLGSEVITRSAEFHEENMKNDDSKKSGDILFGIAFVIALVLSFAAFVIGPLKLTEFVGKKFLEEKRKKQLCELVIRVVLFIVYAIILSMFSEVKKLVRYRGACNKVKNCIRDGHEINFENVKMCSKIDKNNLSSFVITVVFVSSLVFTFVTNADKTIMILLRFATLFGVAAILYEIFYFCNGKKGIGVVLGLPDTFVQLLFTKNPSDEMLRVAMCAATALLEKDKVLSDSQDYQEENTFDNPEYNNPVQVSFGEKDNFADESFDTNMGYGNSPSFDHTSEFDEGMFPIPNGAHGQMEYHTNEDMNYDDGFGFEEDNSFDTNNEFGHAMHDDGFDNREYNRALAYGNVPQRQNEHDLGAPSFDDGLFGEEDALQDDMHSNDMYNDNRFDDPYGFGNGSNHIQNLEDFEYEKNIANHASYNNDSIGNYADLDMGEYDDFSSKSDDYFSRRDTSDRMPYGKDFEEDNDDVLDALDRMFDDDY